MLSRVAVALGLLLALACGSEPEGPLEARWLDALESSGWHASLEVSKLSARWHPQIAAGALTWWTAADGAGPGPEPAGGDRAELFVAVWPSVGAAPVEQRLDRAFLGPLAAPAASPEGSRLAVSAQFDKSGRTQLRLFAHDGDGTWTTVQGGVEQPRSRPEWSPDGQRLAVLATDPPDSRRGDTWVLIVCDRDGVPQDRVALGTYDRHDQAAAAWSPDGETLLVVVDGRLHVFDATTLEARHHPLGPMPPAGTVSAFTPRWNHDGTSVVVSARGAAYHFDPVALELRPVFDGERVDEVIWLGDTDLLLTVASRTVPGGFSPRPSMYVPMIHSLGDSATELLFDHGCTHHLNTGSDHDGLSDDVRRSFALWGR